MKKFITLLLLLSILNVVYSETILDFVTSKNVYDSFFSQKQLANKNAEGWGNSSDFFLSCPNLDSQYYNIIYNTQTISKKFNYIYPHQGLIIEFNAVFLNVEKVSGGTTKHAKLTIDNVDYEFSAVVKNDVYNCVPQTTSSKRDGKTSVKLSINHTKQSFKMSFTPTDLGTVARLGISDLVIYGVLCDDNATFNASTQVCICNSGYQSQNVQVTKDVLFTKCVKV